MCKATLLFEPSLLSKQRIICVADFVDHVIVMILVSPKALIGMTCPVSGFIVMDGAEQSFTAAAYLMAMFIIMVRIAKQGFSAVTHLVAVLIIMIGIA